MSTSIHFSVSYFETTAYQSYRLKSNLSVRVEVGGVCSESIFWNLPKDLLTFHSPFFAGALNGNFLEASGVVTLSEDDPAIFELFVQWLYVGKEYLSKLWRACSKDYPAICIQPWKLGDKLGCLPFKDFIVICLINIHCEIFLDTTTMRLAYKNSPMNSKLRQWVVDQFVHDSLDGCHWRRSSEGFEPEELGDMGNDILKRLMQGFEHEAVFCNPDEPCTYLEVLSFERLPW